MSFYPFFYGLGTGLSLILAIGAQNAFVLKQGLKHQYVFMVCLICALSDSILIFLGVFGFGEIIEKTPMIAELARYFGSAFLFFYGLKSFYAAIKSTEVLTADGQEASSLWQVVMACLAFTWLNPHVYLDTVVLMGAVSSQFVPAYQFAVGAMLASWIFFFSLGYGARLLRPIFATVTAWKILDICVGVMMWIIAFSLILEPMS